MTPLHPHWHATDGDDLSITDIESGATHVTIEGHAAATTGVSRRPAAVVGILLALSLGSVFVYSGNSSSLPADVTDEGMVIHITENGFVPATVSVLAGSRVTWKNDTQIPHVLSSGSESGIAMSPSPIFPGSSVSLDIPAATLPSTYTYISQTDKISGTIVVSIPVASSAASSVAQLASAAPAATLPATTVPQPEASAQSSAPLVVPAQNEAGLLPRNPHTVGSTNTVTPVVSPAKQAPSKPLMATVSDKGYKPYQTPAAGPTLWIVISLSIGALFVVTRKSLKTIG